MSQEIFNNDSPQGDDQIFGKYGHQCASMGYKVLPVYGKSNHLLPHGCADASMDLEKVNQWGKQWPNANVAIQCENVLIIDLDVKKDDNENGDNKDGVADFDEVCSTLGVTLPDCPTVVTPTGGRHMYFKRPSADILGQVGIKWKGKKTAIDTRVGRQYGIAPPSIHPVTLTAYRWEKPLVRVEDLPEVPQALIDHFLPIRGKKSPPTKAQPLQIPREIQQITMPTGPNGMLLVENIKKAAQGREIEILEHVAGIAPELLDGQHHPCPSCGGKDRFRMIDADEGAVLCNQCFNENCGDFIAAVCHFREVDIQKGLRLIDDYLKTPTIEWEPLPVEVFPESLRKYIVESAQSLNVDFAYVGVPALSIVASVIGSAIWIRLKDGWQEPAVLWTALVAGSGSGKSPGLDAAVEPLRTFQKQADKDYKEAISNYDTQQEIYNAELAKWKKSKTPDPPKKPFTPIVVAYLVDDTTSEAIMEILEQNPIGICLAADELSAWLGGFDAYRNGAVQKDLPFWLSIHGVRYQRANRKTGKKIIAVATPAVSICGGIQPKMLQKILSGNVHFFDAGLPPRILFAMPPDRAQYWTEDCVSAETKEQYWKIFETAISWRQRGIANPEYPTVLTLSESAKKAFVDFYNSNADERLGMDSETQKSFWPKLTGYAARLALVFHVVKCIENGGDIQTVVDGETMEAAIQLTQWFKRESLRIVEYLRGETPQIDVEAQAILDVLRRKGKPLSAREVAQLMRLYRGQGGTERAEKKLCEMAFSGILALETEQGESGPAKEVFRLLPKVYEPMDAVDYEFPLAAHDDFSSSANDSDLSSTVNVYELPTISKESAEPVDVDEDDGW